jgi:hypothetical protein
MRRRTVLVVLVVAAGVLGVGLYVAGDRMAHGGDGPRHTLALPGDDRVSDDDALRLSKDVLVADGRYSPDFELIPFGDSMVGRADDPAYVWARWGSRKTGRVWYVQLRRWPGKVECVSYPGK